MGAGAARRFEVVARASAVLGVLSAVLVLTPFAVSRDDAPGSFGLLDVMAIAGVAAGVVALLLAAAAAWRGPRELAAVGAAGGSVWVFLLVYLVLNAD